MPHLYILGTVFFTVYGQLIIKWQVSKVGSLPESFTDKIYFLIHLLLNPWVISGFVSAFLASLFWMAALTKFELSYAYPFMSLAFVFALVLSLFVFNETLTSFKIIGVCFIVMGITLSSRG